MKRLLILILLVLTGCNYPGAIPTLPPTEDPAQPTYTPLPTYTPYPTYTPQPTHTPLPEPTEFLPTQEVTPPDTPDPAPDKRCQFQLNRVTHFLRSDHTTSSSIVAHVDPGMNGDILRFYVYEDVTDEWAYVDTQTRQGHHQGWLKIDDDIEVGFNGTLDICLDTDLTPTEYNTPPSTPVPTIPGPTPTPTAECKFTTNSNINLRDAPGGNWIKTIPSGSLIGAIEFRVTDGYIWAKVYPDPGWMAIGPSVDDLWVTLQTPSICQSKTGWPALLDGVHLIQGAGISSLNLLSPYLESYKALTNAQDVARAFDGLLIYRSLVVDGSLRDCPTLEEWYAPDIYLSRLEDELLPGFDYYEIINECHPPDYSLMADLMVRAMQRYDVCLLMFSFAPGTPDYPEWQKLLPALQYAAEHPCGEGRYHGISLHQPGYMPPDITLREGSYINNPHIAGRLDLIRQTLIQRSGYDIKEFPGPILITEMGWEDYDGVDQVFSCDEVAAGLTYTREIYRKGGLIDGYHLWNFGQVHPWVNLSGCAAQIAHALS